MQLAGRSLLATKSTTNLDASVKIAPMCRSDMVEYMPGLVYFGNSMRDNDYVCFITVNNSVRTLFGLKRVIAEPPAVRCLLPNDSADGQDMWRSFGDEPQ